MPEAKETKKQETVEPPTKVEPKILSSTIISSGVIKDVSVDLLKAILCGESYTVTEAKNIVDRQLKGR